MSWNRGESVSLRLLTHTNLNTCICKKDVERGVSSWGRRRPGRAADCCPGGARLFPRGPFALSVLPSARTAVSPPQTASPDPASPAPGSFLSRRPVWGTARHSIQTSPGAVGRCSARLLLRLPCLPRPWVASPSPRSLASARSRSVCERHAFSSVKSNSDLGLLCTVLLP